MPLDTSSYSLALLRLDGRRWNELRRIHAQISTQAAADGSSYLEMGNTKVICTVSGPAEGRRVGGGTGGGEASVQVEISIAGFSGVERKKRSRTDKYAALLPLASILILLSIKSDFMAIDESPNSPTP
jgi:exosome complex component RRP41